MTPTATQPDRNFVLAITGASGAIYALRLLQVLLAAAARVHLSISPSGALVLKQELGLEIDLRQFRPEMLPLEPDSPAIKNIPQAMARVLTSRTAGVSNASGRIEYHHYDNLMAPIASGSFLTDGMVICPCSGSTLGAVVHGTGENLIHRAASVHLKERRQADRRAARDAAVDDPPGKHAQSRRSRRDRPAGDARLLSRRGVDRRPGRFRRGTHLRSIGRRK